jgi:NitT/TauT family transport system permease protein
VKKRKISFSGVLLPLVFGVLVLIIWQSELLHKIIGTNTFTLPLPTTIIRIIGENLDSISANAFDTIEVAFIGLVLGSLIGYFISIIASIFPKWGSGGLKVIALFNAIPIIALAPVITNLTKDFSTVAPERSMFAKIVLVTLLSAVSMSVGVYRGLTDLKPFSEDLLQTYAATKFDIFIKLRLPNSVSYIFTALRVSIPAAIISTLIAEYFAEYITGVGRQIRENIITSQYSTAWAYITVACAIGIAAYMFLALAERIYNKKKHKV